MKDLGPPNSGASFLPGSTSQKELHPLSTLLYPPFGQATSSPGITTALAALLIERLSGALAAADAAVPLYLKKRKSSSRSSSYGSLKDLLFGSSSNSSRETQQGGSNRPKPELQALVLTKNREIAASLTVSRRYGTVLARDGLSLQEESANK